MAVVANNVFFAFDKSAKMNFILTGVNMNVPVGCIYGLLGPSGCGKTTLLKCLIGLFRPKFGKISVFGYEPGDERSGVPGGGLGYMPQELAMQYDLTIEEMLTYFGSLNSMKTKNLIDEIEFLAKTLQLEKKRLIGKLSGGQKRRVSLAIALLHKSRLLILDEPTVGVDPILSEAIWKLFINRSSTMNTTIIITTHYIDETKRANFVAFMRNGYILEEDNPHTLLGKFHAHSFEDVFLKLCVDKREPRKYERFSVECTNEPDPQISCVKTPYRRSDASNFIRFFHILHAIVWKFVIETRRSPFAIGTVLFTTMSIVFAVKVVIGRTPHNIAVAWVVDDTFNNSYLFNQQPISSINFGKTEKNTTFLSTDLISILATYNNSDTNSETKNGSNNEEEREAYYLPEVLRKSIDTNIIKLVDYSNFASAMRDAKKTIVHGIVHLKSNFSKNYLNCDLMFTEIDEFVSDDTIDSGSIHIHLDFTNMVIGHTIRAAIFSSLQTFRKNIGEHFELNQNLFATPIIIRSINYEEDHHTASLEDVFSVATFITPGIVAFNSFALCIGLCILSLLTPEECNMAVREYAAGVKPVHIVLGQVIARFIFMLFNAFLNLLAMVYILNVPCRGSVPLIIVLMWLQMVLGLNIGVLMSSSMTSSYYSLYTAIAITMCFFSTNGVIWAIEAQPHYFKILMQYSPLYHSSNTLRALLVYSSPSFHVIWPGFAFTVLWTVIAFVATVFLLTMKK